MPNYGYLTAGIEFDETIDLGKYTTRPGSSHTRHLTAVITHRGTDPRRGHYYAHVSDSGRWWLMNDENHTAIEATKEDVLAPTRNAQVTHASKPPTPHTHTHT